MTTTCPKTNLYHRDDPYRAGNSIHGLREAIKNGHDWIDWDAQESKDHTLWNMHWSWLYQDNFFVPDGGPLLQRGMRRVSGLTDKQLVKVRSHDNYKPHRYSLMLTQAALTNKVNIEIELKESASVAALTKLFSHLASLQLRHPDFKVRVKILQGVLTKHEILDEFSKVKRVAEKEGAKVHTMYLNHEKKPVTLDADQRKAVDLVRGRWTKV